MKYKVGDTVIIHKILDKATSPEIQEQWHNMIGEQYTITKCWGSRAEYNIDHPRYVRWKEAELISKNELVKNIINDL